MGGTIDEFLPERGCFYINVLGQRILLERKISITRKSYVSGLLTKCKDLTHKLLIAQGLPSPNTECFYNKTYVQTKAKTKLNKLTYPIILKDASGSNSIGIFPFIKNKTEAAKILKRELPRYRSMIAQEMVFGKEYRVLVLGEKVIGALEMIPPYVIGDGISTVGKLIREKQKETPAKTSFDNKLKEILRDQATSQTSVLKKGKMIYFKKSSCLAEGGETKDMTKLVHDDVRKVCVAASKVVGKHLVGIDIMCKDISKKPTKKSFHILEINGKPDLYIHYTPTHGKTRDVVKEIVKFMVKLAIQLQKQNKIK